MKVVSTHISPGGRQLIMGYIPVQSRYVCWAELILIQIIVPNSSFIGRPNPHITITVSCLSKLITVRIVVTEFQNQPVGSCYSLITHITINNNKLLIQTTLNEKHQKIKNINNTYINITTFVPRRLH